MLKQIIKFEDFNGDMQSETHYFNLTKSEIAELELREDGTNFSDYMSDIMKHENGGLIIRAVKAILKASYGIREDDGKRFRKSEEAWKDFVSTGAYDELYYRMITEPDYAADFVNAVFPSDLVAKLEAAEKLPKQEIANLPDDEPGREPTREELLAMWKKNR